MCECVREWVIVNEHNEWATVRVCVWTLYEDRDGMCNTVAVFTVDIVNLSISSNDKKPLFESMNN